MRVAIVNDSPLAQEVLRRVLLTAPGYQLAWQAANGAEAVKRCADDVPDVILMDLLMPVMDGVEATRQIMAHSPCAILIVTSDVERHMSRVFSAMGYGALDAVNTPMLNGSGLSTADQLESTALLRKIHNIRWLTAVNGSKDSKPASGQSEPTQVTQLVALGASAGGPAALAELLQRLPGDFPAALVLVQHVDEVFAAGMAEWLTSQSNIPVRLAREGDCPVAGQLLMAGTSDHLRLSTEGRLYYTAEPMSHVYRPSIDVFFTSVAQYWSGNAVGVLLTGMGRDGAQGLKAMRNRGFITLAQDEASSAVYGMPKAAAAIDAASEILPLQHMVERLSAVFS
ncbi:hypothetical protein WH50_21635 [Pokkaliibacter plantistimulans]|uniref:Protein-glutamate methylesterase/protein-glutamine glutaminase n=1 Tax=Pokkaliibacter plantistimulans TaxID=1635171 RepID=A0ABX5LRL0_9GAMM|nr:chemotaxis response regulator protein-glutamate methylesterase [Pokkaliibacter plantistimulans]PXF29276.1 hypothetical protein WH50_21635 [Pokkaliibacter plantistimulans]